MKKLTDLQQLLLLCALVIFVLGVVVEGIKNGIPGAIIQGIEGSLMPGGLYFYFLYSNIKNKKIPYLQLVDSSISQPDIHIYKIIGSPKSFSHLFNLLDTNFVSLAFKSKEEAEKIIDTKSDWISINNFYVYFLFLENIHDKDEVFVGKAFQNAFGHTGLQNICRLEDIAEELKFAYESKYIFIPVE